MARPRKTTGPRKTRRPVQSPKKKPNIPVLGIVFGAVGILLVVAIVFSGSAPTGNTQEYGEPVISGAVLPAMPAGAAQPGDDPAIGLMAPEVTGTDFSGKTVEIKNDGTPKAVLFLAHWCPHCQAEVPRVQAWLSDTGGVKGVDIISVTTASNSNQNNWPPSEWLKREDWTSPVIRDDRKSSVYNAYGAGGFPYWVFLNSDGTVALRTSGEMETATLQGILELLVKQ